ncbi:EAL domain-containing protein (plasmid) [Deinococcus aquaticus]|uniref:EAL domain-containing protein n=1 Tax=Deinococcus aquaticus TaxID=328692 RepID=A0ABY7V7X9_9DEIO|nr:EAL domain-containing protein [Deinococcus aquaticus]WDA60413.1 EAL domain-containing protein [Deinococcus aquaticus]
MSTFMPGRPTTVTVPLITGLIRLHGHLHAAPDHALRRVLQEFCDDLSRPASEGPGIRATLSGPHAPTDPARVHALLTLPGETVHLNFQNPPLAVSGTLDSRPLDDTDASTELLTVVQRMVQRRVTGADTDPVAALHTLLLDLSALLGQAAGPPDTEEDLAALILSAYTNWSLRSAQPRPPPAPQPPGTHAAEESAGNRASRPAGPGTSVTQRRLLALGGELARQLSRATTAAHTDLQDRLQRSEAQHRLIVESLNDGVLMISRSGRIQTLSGRAAELLGVPADLDALDFQRLPWEILTADGRVLTGDIIQHGLNGIQPGPVSLILIALRRPSGDVWLQVSQRGVTGLDGQPAALLTLADVTGTRALQVQLDFHAQHDTVTGLPNRAQFISLTSHLSPAPARTMTALRLMDGGPVRSLYGDAAFEEYLLALSQRLAALMPAGTLLGRVSANTLAFAPAPAQDPAPTPPGSRDLLRVLTQPLPLSFAEVHPHLSAGERLWSDGAASSQALADAEAAARSAAQSGLNRALIIDQSRARQHTEQLRLGQRLRRDLQRGRLSVHYQPVVDLRTGELRSAEALARWTDEERGPVPPAEFIPLALELNLMPALTRLVLLRAYRVARTTSDLLGRNFRVALNLSAAELHSEDFRERVSRFMTHHPQAAHYLELEVTEQALIHDLPGVSHTLGVLQAQGLSVALDDFGTGYSSLAVLQQLPVNKLKIDRSFVQGLEHDARQRLITTAVVNLARQLNITVVAEGVETARQLQRLREMNCDQVQGYLISRPVSTRQWLEQVHGWTAVPAGPNALLPPRR